MEAGGVLAMGEAAGTLVSDKELNAGFGEGEGAAAAAATATPGVAGAVGGSPCGAEGG